MRVIVIDNLYIYNTWPCRGNYISICMTPPNALKLSLYPVSRCQTPSVVPELSVNSVAPINQPPFSCILFSSRDTESVERELRECQLSVGPSVRIESFRIIRPNNKIDVFPVLWPKTNWSVGFNFFFLLWVEFLLGWFIFFYSQT